MLLSRINGTCKRFSVTALLGLHQARIEATYGNFLKSNLTGLADVAEFVVAVGFFGPTPEVGLTIVHYCTRRGILLN